MALFGKKAHGRIATPPELPSEWYETNHPHYPEPGERSRRRVAYECPHCFSPNLLRDRELEWLCTFCGTSFCFTGKRKNHYPNPISALNISSDEPERENPLFEQTRRKIADNDENANGSRAIQQALGSREPDFTDTPEYCDEEFYHVAGLRIPIIVEPSAIRIPEECPRCLGKALMRDKRLIWHCACGLKFYFNDRREHFYSANSMHERLLLRDFDGEAKRAELDRREAEKANQEARYDEYLWLKLLLSSEKNK